MTLVYQLLIIIPTDNSLSDRIQILKQYLAEDPADPFNQYALALEYLKADVNEARRLFQSLIEKHPNYLPTYYPYALLLVESKEPDMAEEIFEKGMSVAKSAGDMKTYRELQSAQEDTML